MCMIYFITFLCDFLIQRVSIRTVMSFKKKKKSSKTITENFLKAIPAKALIKEISLTMFQIRVNASFRNLIIVFDQISCECIFMYGYNCFTFQTDFHRVQALTFSTKCIVVEEWVLLWRVFSFSCCKFKLYAANLHTTLAGKVAQLYLNQTDIR